jgi:hypothetical protein
MADVRRLAPGAIVMKYDGLQDYGRLPKRPIVLLYETEPNFGHWVCIVDTPEGIEHFDSYGILPDNELKWVPKGLRHSTGQDVKRLLSMLYDTGQKINYNEHRLQSKDAMTCGRWCALRIHFSYLPLEKFYRLIKTACKIYKLTPDELVAQVVR